MSKIIESFEGNNLPITKETIEALSNAIEMLGIVLSSNATSEHVLVGGMEKDVFMETTKQGVISVDGELIPFMGGFIKEKYDIINSPITIEGVDDSGMPYKTKIFNKYAQYATNGAYSVADLKNSTLLRHNGKSFHEEILVNALNSFLSNRFTAFNAASTRLRVDNFKRLTIYARLKVVGDFSVFGSQDGTSVMTLPEKYRPILNQQIDRLYFNVYMRPSDDNSTKVYPIYVVPSSGEVLIDTMGEDYTFSNGDELYFMLDYHIA
jgi:hypothetical protein